MNQNDSIISLVKLLKQRAAHRSAKASSKSKRDKTVRANRLRTNFTKSDSKHSPDSDAVALEMLGILDDLHISELTPSLVNRYTKQILPEGHKLYMKEWRATDDFVKFVYATTVAKLSHEGVPFTLRLTPEIQEKAAGRAGQNSRTPARFMADRVDRELKKVNPQKQFGYWFTIEEDQEGALHLHGVITTDHTCLQDLRSALKKAAGAKGKPDSKEFEDRFMLDTGSKALQKLSGRELLQTSTDRYQWTKYCHKNAPEPQSRHISKNLLKETQQLYKECRALINGA